MLRFNLNFLPPPWCQRAPREYSCDISLGFGLCRGCEIVFFFVWLNLRQMGRNLSFPKRVFVRLLGRIRSNTGAISKSVISRSCVLDSRQVLGGALNNWKNITLSLASKAGWQRCYLLMSDWHVAAVELMLPVGNPAVHKRWCATLIKVFQVS